MGYRSSGLTTSKKRQSRPQWVVTGVLWALEPSSTYAIQKAAGKPEQILIQQASPSGLRTATMVVWAAVSLAAFGDADDVGGVCSQAELPVNAATSRCGGLTATLAGLAGHCYATTRRMFAFGAVVGTLRPDCLARSVPFVKDLKGLCY